MSRITLVLLAARAALSAPAPVRIPTAWARLASADGHVHGVIDFSLGRVGMIVSLNAVGLLNATAGHAFHVHVNADPGADCSTAGPHFNPLGLDGSACDPADSNACEIGDLSGKHSMIYGSENGVATRRSVVLHQAGSKAPLACGSIISELDGTADGCGNPTGLTSCYQDYYDDRRC